MKNRKKLEQLRDALGFFNEEFAGELKKSFDQKTPVRSGYMLSRNNVQVQGAIVSLTNDAPYFDFVNNGTEHQPAQRMVELTMLEVPQIAEKAMKRAKARARK